jgi:hypothetical protein
LHWYAAFLRRFAQIRDRFANKVLDTIRADSRRIRDNRFADSHSRFAQVRKGSRWILHSSPCKMCASRVGHVTRMRELPCTHAPVVARISCYALDVMGVHVCTSVGGGIGRLILLLYMLYLSCCLVFLPKTCECEVKALALQVPGAAIFGGLIPVGAVLGGLIPGAPF